MAKKRPPSSPPDPRHGIVRLKCVRCDSHTALVVATASWRDDVLLSNLRARLGLPRDSEQLTRGAALQMPNTPVVLRMPPECLECGNHGPVNLQQTIKGDHVILQWCCTGCGAEWPVRRREEDLPALNSTQS